MSKIRLDFTPPPAPLSSFNIGVTGHRDANPSLQANCLLIESTLSIVFELINATLSQTQETRTTGASTTAHVPVRLHTMLVEGVDQMAAGLGLERGWTLVAPLPFGRALNTAINAHPIDEIEALALLTGDGICSLATRQRANKINDLVERARCFELADADAEISALFLAKQKSPSDLTAAQAFSFAASARVALAAQVMIEQSDLIIGIWDGATTCFTGGTGHTIALALSMGTPVVWIDAASPENWQILQVPESLANKAQARLAFEPDVAQLTKLVSRVVAPEKSAKISTTPAHLEGVLALSAKSWLPKSNIIWHGYRRIEALFGSQNLKEGFRNLTQTYERPDQIALGTGQTTLIACADLLDQDPQFLAKLKAGILERFAWSDGISSRLSDVYRGGMVMSFLFSAFAIVGGMAYLPFATTSEKWMFALFELALLTAILAITFVGQRRRWHGRWFETRRVTEYLRSAPVLLMLGVARPIGRWPNGTHTSWPEYYVRHALRSIGLPAVKISSNYLRAAMSELMLPHVASQISYHKSKASRLARAHHRLDQLSEWLFKLAVAFVTGYLGLKLAGQYHVVNHEIAGHFSKIFTFLGVLLPTFGGAIAGIRYFGDFERFSAISDITAQKLEGIQVRSRLLLDTPGASVTYDLVSTLAHATDDAVISEIESWQAVFSGKQISVPV